MALYTKSAQLHKMCGKLFFGIVKESVILILFLLISCSSSKHVQGTWKAEDLKHFVAKFAFETSSNEQNPIGYAYGNVTTNDGDVTRTLTLVFMNEPYKDEIKGESCSEVFSNVGDDVFDETCNPRGTVDMFRIVPCPEDGICGNRYGDVIPGYQFTFKVENITKHTYWYIMLASCYRGKNCDWYRRNQALAVNYDISFVNGYPGNHTDFFTHQISIDQQALPQIFITFTTLYFLLTLIHFLVQKIPKHPVILVQSICLMIQFVAISFGCIHQLLYAGDGAGQPVLREFGRFLDEVVQCLFVLLLLLLARGWRITRVDIRQKRLLFVVWGGYSVVYLTFDVLSFFLGDPLSNQSYYPEWWGLGVLIIRVIVIFWFFFELRATYQQEMDENKLVFYKVLGVVYCLWFLYLPIAVIIASQISEFIRAKTLIGLELSADFLSLCSMSILLLPPFREKYFTINTHLDEASTMSKQYGISYESLSDASKSLIRN